MNLEYALANAERILAQRKSTASRQITYVLYASNDGKVQERKITGYTIKQLINEFNSLGTAYRYAFIYKINDQQKLLRFFNRDKGKKFFALTRNPKRK